MKNQVMQQMAEESDDPDPADEMETLRRIRASVQHVVTEMHQHLSQEIKEVAVKAMPVKSKSMPKVNKREAEVSTTAKDTRRPAEPKVGPKTSRAGGVHLVPRENRSHRFPPKPPQRRRKI